MKKKISKQHLRGTIRKRGNFQWFARIQIDGQGYARTFETRGDAQRWLDDLITASCRDDRVERTLIAHDLTLAQAMRRRLELKSALKCDQEPHTEFLIREYPELCSMKLFTIDELDISAFVDQRIQSGVGPGTVNRSLSLIRDSLIYLSKLHAVCVSIWNGLADDFDEATEPGQWI